MDFIEILNTVLTKLEQQGFLKLPSIKKDGFSKVYNVLPTEYLLYLPTYTMKLLINFIVLFCKDRQLRSGVVRRASGGHGRDAGARGVRVSRQLGAARAQRGAVPRLRRRRRHPPPREPARRVLGLPRLQGRGHRQVVRDRLRTRS